MFMMSLIHSMLELSKEPFCLCSSVPKDTKALVHIASFKPFIHQLPEGCASGILVQMLAEKWWDTTYTFHIAKREMTLAPHDFYRMINLRFDGPHINLKGELGIQLGVVLLGCRYSCESIRNFDLGANYKPCSQVMPNDCALMAWTFLLYLLGAIFLPIESKRCP